jgi:hypothetical protein
MISHRKPSPYLTGTGGANGHLHAIDRQAVLRTILGAAGAGRRGGHTRRGSRLALRAICGSLAQLTANLPAFDRDRLHPSLLLCPFCAWTVAAATDRLERELDLLRPAPHLARLISGLSTDPYLAYRTGESIIAGAPEGDVADPEVIQLLATVSAHTPELLITAACHARRCGHEPGGCELDLLCPACSARSGTWAGELEGAYRVECSIPAPCQVLETLADSFPPLSEGAPA